MDKQDLDRKLIEYHEATVRVDEIDLDSGRLQNREEHGIPADVMADFIAAWLRGDVFPGGAPLGKPRPWPRSGQVRSGRQLYPVHFGVPGLTGKR